MNRVRSGSKSSSTGSDKTDSQTEKNPAKISNGSENGENERVPPKRQSTFSRIRSRISRSSKSPVKSDESKSNGVMKASNIPDQVTSLPDLKEPKDKTAVKHSKEKRKSFFN